MSTLAETFAADFADVEAFETEETADTDVKIELEENETNYEGSPLSKEIDRLVQECENPTASYALVTKCNSVLFELEEYFIELYESLNSIYSKRFPQLDKTIQSLQDYARFVLIFANQPSSVAASEIEQYATSAQSISLQLMTSTLATKPLSSAEWDRCEKLAHFLLSLDRKKRLILQFLTNQMLETAPNTSRLLGFKLTAEILGKVGGLEALATIAPGTLQIVGVTASDKANRKFIGMIGQSDLIENAPEELKKQAARRVCNKTVLSARIDLHQTQSNLPIGDDSQGVRYREEIEEYLEKLQMPIDHKRKKPLPVPLEKRRPKRGGRRKRKWKEKYQMTQTRKDANRIEFGKAQLETEEGEGLGNLTSLELWKQSKKLKAKKTQILNLTKSRSTPSSGIATSLTFTPSQGIELGNPTAATSSRTETSYFDEQKGFNKSK